MHNVASIFELVAAIMARLTILVCPHGCPGVEPLAEGDELLCDRCYFQHGRRTPVIVSRETMNGDSLA